MPTTGATESLEVDAVTATHGGGAPSRSDGALLARGLARVAAHPVLAVFLLALAVRASVAAYVAVRHGGVLFVDDAGYAKIAGQFASGADEGWDAFTRSLFHSNATFLYPLTAIYAVSGPQPFVGQLLVAFAGAGTAATVAAVVQRRLPVRYAVGAGLVVALMPSQILWSALTLKDAFVWVLLAGVAWCMVVSAHASVRRTLAVMAIAGVLLVLLASLREHTLVVAAWATGLAGLAGSTTRGRAGVVRATAAMALTLLVPAAVGIGPGGIDLVRERAGTLEQQRALGAENASTALVEEGVRTPEGTFVVPRNDVERRALEQAAEIERKRAAALAQAERQQGLVAALGASGDTRGAAEARERAAELERLAAELAARAEAASSVVRPAPTAGVDAAFGAAGSSDVERNLRYLPRGLAAMLLEPLPWKSTDNARVRLAKMELVVWYPVLGLAIVGVVVVLARRRDMLYVVLVGGGTACMWALAEGNFGTAYRHRGEFVWAAAVLAAVGTHALRSAWASRRTPGPPSRQVQYVRSPRPEPVEIAKS